MERNFTFKMNQYIFEKQKVLKLTFLLLAGISLQLSAKSFSQTVSLSARNESLETVFSHIEKQSEYTFFYKYNEVKDAAKVTLQLKNVPVAKAIEACLKGQPYSYAIEGKIIIIRKEVEKKAGNSSVFISISGKIVDETGIGLPNVTVFLKGTKTGTSSDANGNYKLTIPEDDGVLVFTSVGYVSREIQINGQTVINVSMQPDSKVLDQVVVVGYGTQKRENLIGSVAQVSAKQLENRPVTQLSNALAGQMTGVTSIQRSGQPGANGSTINIRGVGSFGATSGALVIVDGIPGTLDDIDPNDVESISVLKDASSAAIYGARAANGVILVTTKTGKNQKPVLGYNSYVGFQTPTALPELADSWDYAAMYNEAEGSGTPTYTPTDIQKFRDGSDRDNYPNTNFIKDIISKKGLQTSHNLTINGGTENTQYNVSMGYLFQDGLVIKNNYDRYNIRVNLKTALSDKFDLTTRLAGTRQNDLEPNTPTTFGAEAQGVKFIIGQALRYPSNNAGLLSNGDFGTGIVQKGTPYSFLQSESFNSERTQKLNGNLRLDYKPLNGLKLSGIAGYNQINGKRVEFLATQVINPNITLEPNNLTNIANSTEYYTIQGLAEYARQFGNNNISVLAGYSFEYNRFDQSSAFRDKLPNSNDLTQINAGASDNQQSAGSAFEWALESFFGRVNYSYGNKYLLEGVLRRDGSSRFPASHKYAYFPSAAIGYRIGQESFIKDNISWISELKVKASFGILGNQNIPNYPYQNTYKIGTAYNYPFSSAISSGVARTTLTDPTLHWESTQTTDVGLDFAAFDNRLSFSATYFDRYTYDILYSPGGSVSSTLGFTLSKQNTGKLSNKGWELALGYNDKAGDFSYGLNGNLSIINNKVLDLGVGNIIQPNGMTGNGSSLFIGSPMQIYYGYQADGIFVDAADIAGYAVQTGINPAVKPGDIRYKDISGPDGTPDGKVDATYDRIVLGSNIPKYTFGLNLNAAYKRFDFSMLLQGVAGVKNYMNGSAGYAFFNFGSIQKWQIDGRWTVDNPNPNAEYPRLELITNAGTPNTFVSSFWTLDGSYLRGKNMQIGYTLPETLLKSLKIASLRLYASGENLFLWSNYRKGWDPETGVDSSPNDDSNSVMTTMAYYPILRSYTFGVNIKF